MAKQAVSDCEYCWLLELNQDANKRKPPTYSKQTYRQAVIRRHKGAINKSLDRAGRHLCVASAPIFTAIKDTYLTAQKYMKG